MAPIGVLEYAELAGLDKLLQRPGNVGEVSRGRGRPMRRYLLRQRRGRRWIGLQRRYHIYPVERVQMIEMNHMVLDILRQLHDVANDLRIFWNGNPESVLHSPNRRQRMHGGAHAADALAKRPCIAGIAALQNDLDSPPHRPRGDSIADDALVVENCLNAQVSFNASYWIDYYTWCHGSLLPRIARRLIRLLRVRLIHLFASDHRGQVCRQAHARRHQQSLADLIWRRVNSRHNHVCQSLG